MILSLGAMETTDLSVDYSSPTYDSTASVSTSKNGLKVSANLPK